MIALSSVLLRLTTTGSVLATLSAAVSVFNAVTLPRLTRPEHGDVTESIVVCVPARNEEDDLPLLLADLRAQRACRDLRIIVLDDGSTDATLDRARAAATGDARIDVVESWADPPAGWTGKAAACRTLAERAFGSHHVDSIVFVDADVRLDSEAIAAAATTLRREAAALLCPWPRQRSGSVVEHLIQPMLGFSWMSTLPVRYANRSLRPTTAVSCGQFLMFDAAAYLEIDGHASVASSVTEDLDLARTLRRRGRRTVLVAGAGLVECRMYDGAADLRAGYTRWLWNAFGGKFGSAAVLTAVAVTYLLPPIAAAAGSGSLRRRGGIGFASAVAARLAAGQADYSGRPLVRTHVLPRILEAGTHPLSAALYIALSIDSHRRHARGDLTWKRRRLVSDCDSADG